MNAETALAIALAMFPAAPKVDPVPVAPLVRPEPPPPVKGPCSPACTCGCVHTGVCECRRVGNPQQVPTIRNSSVVPNSCPNGMCPLQR